MQSDSILVYLLFECCVIISYYKDHDVSKYCRYIELISTVPFENYILLMKYVNIGGYTIAANLPLTNLQDT